MPEIKSPTCLVVDDDRLILSLVAEFLETSGYICSTAESAEDALELLARRSFMLMITDLRLGGMNGLELTKRVKKIHPDMPIIVMTGYIDDHSYDEAIEAGAADFLKKPFTMNEVKTRVGRVVRDARLMALLKKKEKAIEEVSTMMIAGLQDEAFQKIAALEAEIARLKESLFTGKAS
jgi:DNA-binding NtrC family response regulator